MREFVILTCYLLIYILEPAKSKIHITHPPVLPVYLKSGSDLDLLCEQSEGFRVYWSKSDPTDLNKDYKLIDSAAETGFLTLAHVDGLFFLRLIKKDVQTWDSGSYKCSVETGTDMPFAVDVYVSEVISESGLITNAGNTTALSCSLVNGEVRAAVRWFKSGIEIGNSLSLSSSSSSLTSSSSSSLYVKYLLNTTYTDTTTDTSLVVKNVGEHDVGEYTCQFELNKQTIFNHSVFIFSHPQIKPMGRSKNLAEGKTLEIICKTWGWPAPNVTWSKEEDTSFLMDERVSFPDNNTLKIDPVVVTDRAIYVCKAISIINDSMVVSTESSILLRVRGKFAPLLPLVGILVEILILCIIIFTYEKKKQRKKLEQERLENSNPQTNSLTQAHRRVSSHSSNNNDDNNPKQRKQLRQQQLQLHH